MPSFLWLLFALVNFRQAVPGYHYQFPQDHFAHPEFRTEWWYYTGNLHTRDGHRYGFELVFFRQGQQPPAAGNPSSWRIQDLYLAHLALTDIDGHRFRYYKRLNRAGPGIAGAQVSGRRIWNGNWEARMDTGSESQTISAVAQGIRFTLHLTPQKPLVIHGENGISQKAEGPGQASYYVSFPRLAVEGVLNATPVTGTAWMDHEWFSNQLDASQLGWEWFSIQLDNHTEFMLFQLRRADGSIDPHSSGTYVAAGGRATHLKQSDFSLQPVAYWTSPRSGAKYPVEWRITIPALQVALRSVAALPDQELLSDDAIGPTYWEGAVDYSGSATGSGYLEMTGYARPMRL